MFRHHSKAIQNSLLSILFLPLLCLAETDPYSQGEILYSQKGCNGCHGIYGEGMLSYPKLVNRPKYLLVKKLKFYRGKKGVMDQTAQIMIPFAEQLSDEEISFLTTYLSEHKEDADAPKYDIKYESWGDGGS